MLDREIDAAENRVKEMERMARQFVERSNRAMQNTAQRSARFEPVQPPAKELPPVQEASRPPSAPPQEMKMSAGAGIDTERLLILLLIALLIKEGADIRLIAALGYLLL